MGDFNHSHVCWRYKTTRHKQIRRLLECVGDIFLLQVIEEPMRRGVMLDFLLTNKEGLVESVKPKGSLGCSDYEPLKFQTLRAVRGADTASSLPWTTGQKTLASSGTCLIVCHEIKPWRKEGPKKAD